MKHICVIGGGLAGGVIASQLTRARKHSVTLIEQGYRPSPYENLDEIWSRDVPKAMFTRGLGIGGTSNYWHGGLTVLDKIDVEGDSVLSDEPKLPIRYAELLDYYIRALKIVDPSGGFDIDQMTGGAKSTYTQFPINSDFFRFKGVIYPKDVFSTRRLIDDAVQEHNLNLIHSTRVEKFIFSDSGTAAAVQCVRDGETKPIQIMADVFVLCAGGIGSPKILLSSSNGSKALRSLPIGKYLIDHPSGFVFKAKLRKKTNLSSVFGHRIPNGRVQYGAALNENQISTTFDRNHILYLRPAITMKDPMIYDYLKRKLVGYKGKRLSIRDYWYLMVHSDLLYEALNFKFGLVGSSQYVSGLTFLEQVPDETQAISKQKQNYYRINWGVNKGDIVSIESFLNRYFKAHESVFERYEIFPNLKEHLDTAGHHSGGCRMSVTSNSGVVGPDSRVFGIDNLFVSDGSVLGYSGHANTGLTIVAMGLRCADSVLKLIS